MFTRDIERAFRLAEQLDCGEVNVNCHFSPDMNGGRGEPRRAAAPHAPACESYTALKAINLQVRGYTHAHEHHARHAGANEMGTRTLAVGSREPPSFTTITHCEWAASHTPVPTAPVTTVIATDPAPVGSGWRIAPCFKSHAVASVPTRSEHCTTFTVLPGV